MTDETIFHPPEPGESVQARAARAYDAGYEDGWDGVSMDPGLWMQTGNDVDYRQGWHDGANAAADGPEGDA